MYPWPERITAVGHTELDRFAAAFPAVRAVRADGRALPFADGEFDLGFSNAVVEHVAGGREGQRGFVHELCRVSRRVYVTTPNRWFPLEVHTLRPFVHWLPEGPRTRLGALRRRARSARPEGLRRPVSLQRPCTEQRHDARRCRPQVKAPLLSRSRFALYVLIVGLAVHNLAMALLWRAGLHGGPLTVVSAWKDVLLARRARRPRRLRPRLASPRAPRRPGSRSRSPASSSCTRRSPRLGWAAAPERRASLYAARHDLLPVGGYFLGRGAGSRPASATVSAASCSGPRRGSRPSVSSTSTSSRFRGGAVCTGGTATSSASRYFGLSGLPENFVYNAGNGVVFRRLTSTFLSPLASAYLLVVALFLIPLRRPLGLRARGAALRGRPVVAHAGRAGRARRRPDRARDRAPLVAARRLRGRRGRGRPRVRSGYATSRRERTSRRPSCTSRSRTRPGIPMRRTTRRRPTRRRRRSTLVPAAGRAHGPAASMGVRPRQLGRHRRADQRQAEGGRVDLHGARRRDGAPGRARFVAWSLAILWRLLRRVPWLAAAFVAVLVIGIQTDVIGVPWIAVVVWALAGAWMEDPGLTASPQGRRLPAPGFVLARPRDRPPFREADTSKGASRPRG